MNRIVKSLVLLFLLCFASSSYGMLVSECRDMKFVAEKADVIIRGEVTKIDVQRNKLGHIHTYVTVRVSEYFKGQDGAIITLKLPGGMLKDGTPGIGVEDTPSFKLGQEGYLYLRNLREGDEEQFYGSVCGHGILEDFPSLWNFSVHLKIQERPIKSTKKFMPMSLSTPLNNRVGAVLAFLKHI